jgi:hypothetical protein
MPDLNYLDMDVNIERTATGFRAEIVNSPAGQASAGFVLPFSDLELENFLLRISGARRSTRRIDSTEMLAAKTFGGRLFDAVFTGDVRGVFTASQSEAERQGAGLRVRLRLGNAPELCDLPWEFLYNSTLNRFLALSTKTPLVRFLELPEPIRPLIVKPPLRVLAMISSPSDFDSLDVEREFGKLKQSLADMEERGLIAVEKLQDASLTTLQKRLQQSQYHIFHFIGHGGFDERNQDGVLILEDDNNRGRQVSAQFLGTILHDHGSLRLAVLNACEGARTSRADPFAGVAPSLVQQGIPAVIAMQFEITDDAAVTFSQAFYSALSNGYPVDAALAEARKTIFASGNETEWGTPVLYLRSPDGKIFDVQPINEDEKKRAQVVALVRDAQTAFSANDLARTLEKSQAALALDPGNSNALTLLTQVREKQKPAEPPLTPKPDSSTTVPRAQSGGQSKIVLIGGAILLFLLCALSAGGLALSGIFQASATYTPTLIAVASYTPTATTTSTPHATSTPSVTPVQTPSSTPTPTRTITLPPPIIFQVTGVTISVNPSSSTTCPATFNYSAVLSASAAGTVTYQWQDDYNKTFKTESVVFTSAGSKTVTYTLAMPVTRNGWASVAIITPNQAKSNQVNYAAICPAPGKFEGFWYTNFGEMTLTQNGSDVTGSYTNAFSNRKGSITGRISGNTLTGTWTDSIIGGTLTWTLGADGNTFDGSWLQARTTTSNDWCGARAGAGFPSGCSFAGTWNVNGFGKAGCTMTLTRTDNKIAGTFCQGSVDGTIQYQSDNSTLLSGTWNAQDKGPFKFYLLGYNANQFQGYFYRGGNFEWCGWRSNSSQPSPCMRQ